MGKITDALTKVEKERHRLPASQTEKSKGRDVTEQVTPRPEPAKTGRRTTGPVLLWVGLVLLGGFVLLYAFGRVGERSSNAPPAPLPLVQLPEPESTPAKREAVGGEDVIGQSPVGTMMYANVEIIGDSQFVDEVKAALRLLEIKAKRSFSLVKKQIGKVEKSNQDSRNFKKIPAVIGLSNETTFRSTTWLAGSLAESACYSKEYHQPRSFFGFWKQGPDKECSQYKLEVMQRIGAPQEEIDVTKWAARSYQ